MAEVHSFNRDLLRATESSQYHSRSGSSCSTIFYIPEGESISLHKEHRLVEQPKSRSFWKSLGSLYSIILISSTFGVIAAIGFISFLWFADDSNLTWRFLASMDYITKAVAISSLLLRTSIAMQAGIATSMLAAIALECSHVLLSQLASVSTIRNTNSGPYSLAWLFFAPSSLKARGFRGLILSAIIAVLAITTFLSQFTSTVLLSDVSSGLVSGFPVLNKFPTSLLNGFAREFLSASSNAVWLRRPTVFASFAEELPNPSSGPGYEDTGSGLRAFLPVSAQSDRILMKNYNGLATVVDTRTVCFTPQLSEIDLRIRGDYLEMFGNVSIPQSVIQAYNNSTGNYPRLVDYSSQPGGRIISPNGTSFVCQADPDAFMTLCQLRPKVTGSFMVGQLQKIPKSNSTWSLGYENGNQYLVIKTDVTGYIRNITKMSAYVNYTHSPWLHTSFAPKSDGPGTPRIDLDISLCYNSLSGADVPIIASTDQTRSEAAPAVNNGHHNFASVVSQLGLNPNTRKVEMLSPNSRGLLHLTFPSSTQPNGNKTTFSTNSDYIVNSIQQAVPVSPFTTSSVGAVSIQFSPDASIGLVANADFMTFFNDTQTAGGTLSFAMQSLLTLLVGSAYYDQLPNFNNNTMVQRTDFLQAQIPGGEAAEYLGTRAGWKRGFGAVLGLTAVHVLVMSGIVVWFRMCTHISHLNNAWQTIAQIHDPLTEKYIAHAYLASDAEIARQMRSDGRGDLVVGVGLMGSGSSTEIKGVGFNRGERKSRRSTEVVDERHTRSRYGSDVSLNF